MSRANDRGYTLAEMLVALIVIGLAVGGLSQGIFVLSRHQAEATRTIDSAGQLDHLALRLAETLESAPDATDVSGDEHALRIAHAARGSGWMGLDDRLGSLRFAYQAGDGPHPSWPPSGPYAPRLLGVAIFDHSAKHASAPVAYVALRDRQPMACEYDVIALKCRQAAP